MNLKLDSEHDLIASRSAAMGKLLNSELVVLDCTLRDGGYYNNWAFEDEFISKYINVLADTPVSILELGYRQPNDVDALVYEQSLTRLIGSTSLNSTQLAVMLDAKKFVEHKQPLGELIDKLFLPAAESALSMVRVAVHFEQVAKANHLVSLLHDKGYRVALNLMQVGSASIAQLSSVIASLAAINGADVVYIADSLGAMSANKVTSLLHMLKESVGKATGFHAHDNKGLALLNSQAAVVAGATFIDATLMGMGRGAGNTKTEQLLPLLGISPRELQPVQQFLLTEMSSLYYQYMWGNDALYQFAADNAMHPMYVQDIKSRVNQDLATGFDIILTLAKDDCRQYKKSIVDEALRAHLGGTR